MIEKIAKLFSGELTIEEKAELDIWLSSQENQTSLKRFERLWMLMEDYKGEYNPDLEKGLKRFLNHINEEHKNQITRKIPLKKIAYWAAASVIFIVSSFTIWNSYKNSNSVQYYTKANQNMTIYLPDSSCVVMNENSRIIYKKTFVKREVNLKGEAFFEIVRDTLKPFSVVGENSMISVLGTSFNVRTSKKDGTDQVHVITGKVSFVDKKKNDVKVVLHKGNSAELKNHEITEKEISDYNFLFYKTHQLDFSNITLDTLVLELEKYYHEEIKIFSPEICDVKITSTYKDMSIDEIMNELEIILNISAQKEDKIWQLKIN